MINNNIKYLNRKEINSLLSLDPKIEDLGKALDAREKELLADMDESNEFEMFMYACYKTPFPLANKDSLKNTLEDAFKKRKVSVKLSKLTDSKKITVTFAKYDKPQYVVTVPTGLNETQIQKVFFDRLKSEQFRRKTIKYDLDLLRETRRIRCESEAEA